MVARLTSHVTTLPALALVDAPVRYASLEEAFATLARDDAVVKALRNIAADAAVERAFCVAKKREVSAETTGRHNVCVCQKIKNPRPPREQLPLQQLLQLPLRARSVKPEELLAIGENRLKALLRETARGGRLL